MVDSVTEIPVTTETAGLISGLENNIAGVLKTMEEKLEKGEAIEKVA